MLLMANVSSVQKENNNPSCKIFTGICVLTPTRVTSQHTTKLQSQRSELRRVSESFDELVLDIIYDILASKAQHAMTTLLKRRIATKRENEYPYANTEKEHTRFSVEIKTENANVAQSLQELSVDSYTCDKPTADKIVIPEIIFTFLSNLKLMPCLIKTIASISDKKRRFKKRFWHRRQCLEAFSLKNCRSEVSESLTQNTFVSQYWFKQGDQRHPNPKGLKHILSFATAKQSTAGKRWTIRILEAKEVLEAIPLGALSEHQAILRAALTGKRPFRRRHRMSRRSRAHAGERW